MNKHINDLAVKAGAHVRNVCYGHGDFRIELQLSDESIEKFAGLIQYEIIKVIERCHYRDGNSSHNLALEMAVAQIKEHFGVE